MRRTCRRVALALVCLAALAVLARAETPAPKAGPAPGKYASEYEEMSKPAWQATFPYLGPYEVLAPSTGGHDQRGSYNCIAHTLRVYDRWIWPGARVEDFDRLYAAYGFRRISTLDYRFRRTAERVVLYGKILPDGSIECTHCSKQLCDGTWTSKLGAGPLVRHVMPESLSGPSYGEPVAVYVRPRPRSAP